MTTIQTSNINKDSHTAPRVVKRELPFKGSENNTSQNTSQPQRRKKSNNGAKAFFGLLLLVGGGFVFRDHLAKFAESVGLIKKAVKPEGEVAKAAENAASGGNSVISDIRCGIADAKDKFVNWFKRPRKTEVKKTEAPKASPKPVEKPKTPVKKAVQTSAEDARIEVPVTRTEITNENMGSHIDPTIDDSTRLPGENSSISRKLNEIWDDQPVESAKTSVWQDFKEFIGIKEKTPDKVMAGKSTKIDSQPLEDITQSDAEIKIVNAPDIERSKNVSKGKNQSINKSEPEESLLDKALKSVGLDKKSQRLKTAKKELAAIDANIAKTEATKASRPQKDLVDKELKAAGSINIATQGNEAKSLRVNLLPKKLRAGGIKVEEAPQQVSESLGQIAENFVKKPAVAETGEEVIKKPVEEAAKPIDYGFGESHLNLDETNEFGNVSSAAEVHADSLSKTINGENHPKDPLPMSSEPAPVNTQPEGYDKGAKKKILGKTNAPVNPKIVVEDANEYEGCFTQEELEGLLEDINKRRKDLEANPEYIAPIDIANK